MSKIITIRGIEQAGRDIGDVLRDGRLDKGWTSKVCAAQIGVNHHSSVIKAESEGYLSLKAIVRHAEALGLEVSLVFSERP